MVETLRKSRGFGLLALWIGVVVLAACGRDARVAGDADLLLLTLDTVRADRWGTLGDPEARTPTWDRLARGGTLAFEGRAPAPITLPSHTSMLTGLPPVVLRDAEPVLIWPVDRATAKSAIVASSVSPLRCLVTLV